MPGVAVDFDLAGMRGQIVSVDIEEKLISDNDSSSNQRIFYGRYYAHSACTWIKEIKKFYPKAVVLIYTTPSVFWDYLQYAYPEDNVCLQEALIWAARTTVDGGDVVRSAPTHLNLEAQRLCLVPGGNRCVIHQYSHRAVFASLGTTVKNIPPHMDVNRFFKVKPTNNNAGVQYVRSEERKPLKLGARLAMP